MIRTHKIILIISFFISLISESKAQQFSEYEVKAVYLYQFARFVSWPDNIINSKSNFVIGIYGENPFGDLTDAIYADKLFQGKVCVVKNITSVEEALGCQMIFISGKSKFESLQFIKKLNNAPVLIVGNAIDDFCMIGGMINFTKKESEFRFEINPVAATRSGVSISSKLFAVAKVINSPEDHF